MSQHAIVYLGDALNYFFNNATINLYDGDTPINLMDLFPMVKQRYASKDTITRLIENYNINKDPDYNYGFILIPDDLYNTSFGGTIPAAKYRDPATGDLITMQEAVETNLIPNYLNTFQVIQSIDPNFDPKIFKTFYIRNIKELNWYELENLDQGILNAILEEHTLAEEILERTRMLFPPKWIKARRTEQQGLKSMAQISDHIDVYNFIREALTTNYLDLITKLINHPSVNRLYSSIVLEDIDAIRANLLIVDPRADNHKAYFLAVETKNPNIIKMVKDNIVERNFLHKELLERGFQSIAGRTNIPQIIYEQTKRLM